VTGDTGWVWLHRKIFEWEWWTDPNTRILFITLLLLANHKPGRWKGVKINRGQLITGRKKLAKITGLSEKSVRTALKRLKSTSELAIKATNRFSLITIVNYDIYQGGDLVAASNKATQRSNKGPAKGQQRATNNNDNNEKNTICASKEPPGWREDTNGYQDHVWLKEAEYEKLLDDFGMRETNEKIAEFATKIADGEKTAKGKPYTSYTNHNSCLRRWLKVDADIAERIQDQRETIDGY